MSGRRAAEERIEKLQEKVVVRGGGGKLARIEGRERERVSSISGRRGELTKVRRD